jgi:linoleoyl-CoA desaturase
MQHNDLHHGTTNVVGFDSDLELAPFARLAPSQPWRRRFRWQAFYIWPLYGFLTLKSLLVSDVVALVVRRMGRQPLRRPVRPVAVMRIGVGKLAHLGWALTVPLWFNPWWKVLLGYLLVSWCVGFILAIVFQLAHCVDVAEFPGEQLRRRGDEFAAHQLRTTVDVASPIPVLGHVFRWLVGGLDHQIEHHLSPRLPHTVYPIIAKRFRVACAEHGFTYRLHDGVWSALCSHARWLQAMSAPNVVRSAV